MSGFKWQSAAEPSGTACSGHLPWLPAGCSVGCLVVHLGTCAVMRPPGFCYRSSTGLALRYVALIIQNMVSIFLRIKQKSLW